MSHDSRLTSRRARALVATGLLTLLVPLGALPAAQGVGQAGGQLVAAAPRAGTPHVLDGRVLSVAQVGTQIVLGGTFTQARNDGSTTVLTRRGLLAFDAATGQISPSFDPAPDRAVNAVIPAGDGETVFVGGAFTSVAGQARSRVARLRVSDGALVGAFNAGTISGAVHDLRLAGSRLWLAGAFAQVRGNAQRGLATVSAATGAFDPFMRLTVSGVHNGGTTTVKKIDVSRDGSRLVGVGNFRDLAGSRSEQLLMLSLTGATAQPAPFRTSFYQASCASAFDSYVRDVDLSPDGSFFVVSTTGAYRGATSPCDTTARFETSAGAGAQPSWRDSTGGDTTYGVEIGDGVVYTGGHARWQNNPHAADEPGPGAVPRLGIAALDPVNGLPYTWNPTRSRGVGVFDFLLTGQGLWVGSDTDRLGGLLRSRIGLLPSPGLTIAPLNTPRLPATVYRAGTTGLTQVPATTTGFGSSTSAPTGGRSWGALRGAFMLGSTLYTGWSDGTFTKQSFNGSAFGSATPVDTHDRVTPLTEWQSDLRAATSMFYDRGRIYFTRAGSSSLFYRYFSPQSDVVGAYRFTTTGPSGLSLAGVRGAFLANDSVYWADGLGRLVRYAWQTGTVAGSPTGSPTVVSGPGVDALRWDSGALFARTS